ncbi:MAG: GNAT family N-acetyltransferase [Ruminococcus sp.]|nr:GNAT family N-acetyltransferase [Ruminococcus sp.]
MEFVLKEIEYGSQEYEMTRELRNRIMRIPIGLNIYDQDYTFEVNSRIVGAFDGETMLGCSIVGKMNGEYCLDFLCVDENVQKTGIGSVLLQDVEKWLKEQGTSTLVLEARVSAQKFYEKHGYEAYGQIYLMEKSPVDHIMMKKEL